VTVETLSRWALIALATIAIFAALWLAKSVFAPLALAFVIAVMLSPLSDFWNRLGVPVIIGSLFSLSLGLAVLTALVLALEPLAANVYEKAPRIKWELRESLTGLQDAMRGLDEVSEEVNKVISPEDPEKADADGEEAGVEMPRLSDALFLAPAILGQVMVFAGGLYFFLLCRQDVYRWLAKFSRGTDDATVQGFRKADRLVSRYWLTITMINAGFGIAVAIALQLIGMPGALMWAFVAALMNFVMYLGPVIVAVALTVAGTVVFDGFYSFMPAAIFVTLNVMEGQFVTPSLVGHLMRVNPLLVFLSLCLWLWLWGPIGGIVAIPLLVWAIAVSNGLSAGQSALTDSEEPPPSLILR